MKRLLLWFRGLNKDQRIEAYTLAAAALLVVVLVWPTFRNVVIGQPNRPFDAKQWIDWGYKPRRENHRYTMVKDLRENVLEKGMPQAKVAALLGRADEGTPKTGFRYRTGSHAGYSVLVLRFDDKGQLLDAWTEE